jgi:mono/diheme cytochrome c family protein
MNKTIFIIAIIVFLTGCSPEEKEKITDSTAGYGEEVFNNNCVSCHGSEGRGLAKNWKVKDENGNFPAPPLNGTAHTWHHSPAQLLYTINNGGADMGGQMPGFSERLNEEQKQALIDYIYSLWPREIQTKYDERFK